MTHVYPFKDDGSDRIRSQVFDKRSATEAPAASSGGGSTPTGTGFRHVTTGTEDAAARYPSDAEVTFTDITTNNASTTKHGYLKKLSNVATEYMDGTGAWSVPAGGGGAWTLAGSGQTAAGVWDFAVDGAKANVEFADLAGYTDILLIAYNVTKASNGILAVVVSVNNGSSFYTTSGEYLYIPGSGLIANAAFAAMHGTNATAARSGAVRISGANVATGVRLMEQVNNPTEPRIFVASTSAINAVRVSGSGGGNLTGGTIRCFVR